MAFQTDHQGLVLDVSLHRPNLDALPDVTVAQTAELRTDDVLEILELVLEEIGGRGVLGLDLCFEVSD